MAAMTAATVTNTAPMLCHLLSCPLSCTGIPSETALPIYSKNIEFLQRHSSHALGPARPALRPSGPVDRFERLVSKPANPEMPPGCAIGDEYGFVARPRTDNL